MDESGTRSASLSRTDSDGVRITVHPARGASLLYKLLALAVVGGLALYVITMTTRSASTDDGGNAAPSTGADGSTVQSASAASVSPPGASTTANRQVNARPLQSHDPQDLANFVSPGAPAPKMEQVIEELHKAGIHTGLGAFSPPGTSPPLKGLAVPPDYVLPPGYVRHGQATDDGQAIEPILMYSPDFEGFDSKGERIDVPESRIVPAHLAPPGLPVRVIEIPPPREPGSSPD